MTMLHVIFIYCIKELLKLLALLLVRAIKNFTFRTSKYACSYVSIYIWNQILKKLIYYIVRIWLNKPSNVVLQFNQAIKISWGPASQEKTQQRKIYVSMYIMFLYIFIYIICINVKFQSAPLM